MRKWLLTTAYAPYFVASILFALSFAVILGACAMMKPALVVSTLTSKLSWGRTVLYGLLFGTLVLGAAAVAHYVEQKRYKSA